MDFILGLLVLSAWPVWVIVVGLGILVSLSNFSEVAGLLAVAIIGLGLWKGGLEPAFSGYLPLWWAGVVVLVLMGMPRTETKRKENYQKATISAFLMTSVILLTVNDWYHLDTYWLIAIGGGLFVAYGLVAFIDAMLAWYRIVSEKTAIGRQARADFFLELKSAMLTGRRTFTEEQKTFLRGLPDAVTASLLRTKTPACLKELFDGRFGNTTIFDKPKKMDHIDFLIGHGVSWPANLFRQLPELGKIFNWFWAWFVYLLQTPGRIWMMHTEKKVYGDDDDFKYRS